MKCHKVHRVINGIHYVCLDVGCDDFERAERNREMVAQKLHIKGYLEIEEAVSHTPLNSPLPKWIPIGVVPSVADGEKHTFSGGRMENIEVYNPKTWIDGGVIDNS